MNIVSKYRNDKSLQTSEQLQLAYKETLRKSDAIIKEEGTRRLRLQILLLEVENDELHEQLEIEDDRVEELEHQRDDVQQQLEQVEADFHTKEGEVRLLGREINTLKAELNSMNGVSADSTKILTEKLALARELATLKPELDHLRSQATYQQAILGEKLTLQRQVSSLEVELETEKRATQRASHTDRETDKEAGLQKDLESLQKQLTQEKRGHQKAINAASKGSSELETQNARLSSKVEQLKSKLRETKDELREARAEWAEEQANISKRTSSTTLPIKRKRDAPQESTDANIGTPDGVAVRGRRQGVNRGISDHALRGEKSMFSITPFLNRTISVPPEASQEDDKYQGTNEVEPSPSEPKTIRSSPKPVASKESAHDAAEVSRSKGRIEASKSTRKNVLGVATSNTTNLKAGTKRPRLTSELEIVTEEENGEEVGEFPRPMAGDQKRPALKTQAPSGVGQDEPKKKKRKVLGATRTLFDEDDGEATKRPAKKLSSQSKFFGTNSLGGAKSAVGGFGSFSPLKKDKRGTQASFLM